MVAVLLVAGIVTLPGLVNGVAYLAGAGQTVMLIPTSTETERDSCPRGAIP
jgi:hypothetical protein